MSILKGEFNEELPTHNPTASSESTLLEHYLEEVENGLYPLTPGERRAELMELRAHLYALVRANQELTPQLTEEEAATAALAQFGPVMDIAAELVRVNRDQREAPLRQLGLALLTCLVGGSLSYVAYTVLNIVQTLAVAPGVVWLISWPSGLALVGAPLLLGTIVGRAFPRALYAWLPLVVAAATWFFTLLLNGVPRALQHVFIDPAGFWRLAQQHVLSINTLYKLFYNLPVLFSFLVLAWTGQIIAHRSKSGKGFVAWCKEVVRHLPDTWVGGLVLGMVADRLLYVITGPILLLFRSSPSGVSPMRRADTGEILIGMNPVMLESIGVGWMVGRVLPKRGWTGSLYSLIWAVLSTLISYNLGRQAGRVITMPENYFWARMLILGLLPIFATMLTAYFVGKHRLKAK